MTIREKLALMEAMKAQNAQRVKEHLIHNGAAAGQTGGSR